MSDEGALAELAWWAEEAVAAKTERDNWIRVAHAEGFSLREIAEAAGLTHAGVKKIIDRGAPTRENT